MSKLKAVKPKTAEPKKPAILIMGEAGMGKTFTSLDFPKVYYIDVERGATNDHYTSKLEKSGGVYFGPDQGSQSFDEVLEQVRALRSEKHDYKTLVIDSFTKLFNIAIADEQERLKQRKQEDAFGASKKPAVAYARQLVNLLGSLDMNVILICHVKPNWEGGEQRGVVEDGWDKLRYELDLTMEIRKQGGARMALIRKSRLEQFPEGANIPWSYEEFSKRWGKDVIEQEATPVCLATEDQLKEFRYLSSIVKIPEGQEDKWLKVGGVEKFEDMATDKMQLIINILKSKITATTN